MRIIVNLLSLTIILCCSVQVRSQQLPLEIRIDPAAAAGGSASEFFEKVIYIPLETNSKSAFGIISQMYVTEKYFIIFDQTTNAILIFYANGKFHTKIIKDPYSGAKIYYDRFAERILVPKGSTFTYYDLDGKILFTSREANIGAPHSLSKTNTAFYDYRVSARYLSDTVSHEIYLVENGKRTLEFLPYNMKKSKVENYDWLTISHGPFYDTGVDSSVLYCRPYDYGIYEVSPHGMRKKYNVVLPLSQTFPKELLTDTAFKQGTLRNYFANNIEKVNGITFSYVVNQSLFFKLNDYNASMHDSYLYNLVSGTLISVGKVVGDPLTSFLPMTDFGVGTEFMNRNFLTSDAQFIYGSIPPAALFKAWESRANKKQLYDTALSTLFEKGNRQDNPVVVKIRPKKTY